MSGSPRTIVQVSPARSFGGAEQVLLAQAAGLRERGWRPVVLHEDRPGLERLSGGARERGIPVQAVRRVEGRWPWRTTVDVARRLRSIRPAAVQAHLGWPGAGIAALLGAVLAGVPTIVVTIHLWLPPTRRTRWWHRLLARRIAGYVAVSEGVADRIEVDLGIDRRRIHVVPNGIDVEWFATDRDAGPGEARPDGARPGGTRGGGPGRSVVGGRAVVATIAQLRPQKRLDLLVEAAVDLPEVSFIVAGDGPERAALEARAERRGVADRVRFVGFREDVRPILDAADIVVLPSDAEGLPLSLLEAMAAGVAVVATDVPGTREIVSDGVTGLLVPSGDARALASAIARLVADDGLRATLGAAGREAVRGSHDVGTMVERLAAVLEALVGSGSGGVAGDGRAAASPSSVRDRRDDDWRYLAGRPDRDEGGATIETVVDASPGGMASAAQRVGPGGRVVVRREASILPGRGAGGVTDDRLRAAGLEPVRRWLAWPGRPGQPVRRWIPTGSPAASAWLRDELVGSSGVGGRGRWRWIEWSIRRRVGLLPEATVARRIDDAAPSGRLADLVERALGAAGTAGAAEPTGAATTILLAHGHRPENKIVLLVLPADDPRPRVAVKIARDPAWNGRLDHEASVLRSLAAAGLGPRDGVPSVLATATLEDGALAVAETALSGRRRSGASRRIGFAVAAAEGTTWLIRLARATARPSDADDSVRLRAVDEILDRLATDFAGIADVTDERSERLRHATAGLPVVAEHRDVAPWNLLGASTERPDSIAAVDWESSALDGWPGLDLAYLLVQLAIESTRARTPEARLAAARRVWDPTDELGAVAAAETKRYGAAFGIDAAALAAIRPLAWAIHAGSEYRRAVADHGPNPPAAVLVEGLYTRLWADEA